MIIYNGCKVFWEKTEKLLTEEKYGFKPNIYVKKILTCLVFLNLRACECGLYRLCSSRSLARVDADGEQDSTIEYLLLWLAAIAAAVVLLAVFVAMGM